MTVSVQGMSPHFRKSQTFKLAKKPGKLDRHGHNFVIFSQPLDKHGITLLHITYPLLEILGIQELMSSSKAERKAQQTVERSVIP